jgi:hypothetical protein
MRYPDSTCQSQFIAYRVLSFPSSLMRRIPHASCYYYLCNLDLTIFLIAYRM